MTGVRSHSKLLWMGALASLVLTACDGAPPLTAPADGQTFVLNLDRASDAGSRAPHTLKLENDRSVTITSAGHTISLKGKNGFVDGRLTFRLTDRLAARIEEGVSELEYKNTKEYRDLQDAAARCKSKAGLSTDRLGDTSGTMTASSMEDVCINLGLALWNFTEAIDNFWGNFWSNLAGDVIHDIGLGATTGIGAAAAGAPVVLPIAGAVGALVTFDLAGAVFDYQMLKFERNIIATEMRENHCV